MGLDVGAAPLGASGRDVPAGRFRAHYLWFDIVVDAVDTPMLDALKHRFTSDVTAEPELSVTVDETCGLVVDGERIDAYDELDTVTQAYGRVHGRLMDDAHRRGYSRIHAAAVQIGSSRIAIAGPSGAGKTSLTLRLAALGATVLGDEALLLRDGSSIALPRRIHVKSSGSEYLPPAARAAALRLPYSPEILAVEPTALHAEGADRRLTHAPVDLVVLLGPHGEAASITDVSAVEAMGELLSDSGHYASSVESLDVTQGRLVAEVARLAHRVPIIRSGGSVAERAEALLRMLT